MLMVNQSRLGQRGRRPHADGLIVARRNQPIGAWNKLYAVHGTIVAFEQDFLLLSANLPDDDLFIERGGREQRAVRGDVNAGDWRLTIRRGPWIGVEGLQMV